MNETLDRLLNAYLDGTLSPARRSAVEKRLSEPRVSKRLAQLKALDEALRASVAQPSDVQSRRMWLAIKGQIQASTPVHEPWYAFLQRRWFVGYGLAGAAAAVALGFYFVQAPTVTPMAAPMVTAEAETRSEAVMTEAAVAPRPVRRPAAQRSEVERALAESPVDGLIERFLAERPVAVAAAMPVRSRKMAMAAGGATLAAAYDEAPMAAMRSEAAPAPVQALGGTDRNGFWDWRAAGLAMNQRDWTQARLELEAAMAQAPQSSERAFAASALSLLAAAGGPLQGTQDALPSIGDLRVLEAGVWQLQVDSRLARFSRNYVARIPGFRVEGDTLLLDMTFDRGSFAAGSRFTRVSGEDPARVFDAMAQPVALDSFSAPQGAVYKVQERELHLR